VFAHAARLLRLTPTAVTLVSIGVGVLGGALLYVDDVAWFGFALIVLYGILDSSDGQLARMTGQTSEFGRVLDGLGGYVVHAAIYLTLILRVLGRGEGFSVIVWAALAGAATAMHAQMYDYHRTAYARLAIDGVAGQRPADRAAAHSLTGILRVYEWVQTRLAGPHREVEAAIADRAIDGAVRADDRARYRECFYWPVRGWNLFGDNTRRYALGVATVFGHPEWLFAFLLVPMNLAFVLVRLWQARADRRFLARPW
jgi:hypothetical protein